MSLPTPVMLASRWAARALQPGDCAVDATAGNGHDTLTLARAVSPTGRVYAFDIQKEAVETTRWRLREAGVDSIARVIQAGHESMTEHVAPDDAGRVGVVMFNLGYLPGGERSRITTPRTTLAALDGALSVLRPGGLITVVCYPGHPGGDTERDAVLHWAKRLPVAQTVRVAPLDGTPRKPELLVLQLPD